MLSVTAHAEYLIANMPNDPAATQWAVTAAFYSAVHAIEAHPEGFGRHSTSHRSRKNSIWRLGVDQDVIDPYEQLKQWSEGARYRGDEFSAQEVAQFVLGQELPNVLKLVGL